MQSFLHVVNGDAAAGSLKAATGKMPIVWRDLIYTGPRLPGLPDAADLPARADWLATVAGGRASAPEILTDLVNTYGAIEKAASSGTPVVVWADGCVFDQAMLAHVLTCLHAHQAPDVFFISLVDQDEGSPIAGLGALQPDAFTRSFPARLPVGPAEIDAARRADRAFATESQTDLTDLAQARNFPLPHLPQAAHRWIQEFPTSTSHGWLRDRVLAEVRDGAKTPAELFRRVAQADPAPLFWGDLQLWQAVNALASLDEPLLTVQGPATRLPLANENDLRSFTIAGR